METEEETWSKIREGLGCAGASVGHVRVKGSQKEKGNWGHWNQKKSCGSRSEPSASHRGARDDGMDCLICPSSSKYPFEFLAARQTSSTEYLFSVKYPLSFDRNSDKIDLSLAHRAVSGNRLLELLSECRSHDGPFLLSGASLSGDAPTSHNGNQGCREGP